MKRRQHPSPDEVVRFRDLKGIYVLNAVLSAVGESLVDSPTIDFTFDASIPSITADVKDDSLAAGKLHFLNSSRLLGRSTAGAGEGEEITVGGDLTQSGSDFTIANNAVTFAKFQDITDERLLGRSAGSSGDIQEITVGAGLTLAAGALTAAGGSGDVVGPASSTDNAITRYDGATGKLIQDSAAFVDDSGRVLTGSATAQSVSGVNAAIQVLGTTDDTTGFTVGRWGANASAPNVILSKSRGAAIGTTTVVQNNDALGSFSFVGANSGGSFSSAAFFRAQVDGAPGATSVPGLISFGTAPVGGAITDRMVIKNTGTLLLGTTTETASAGRMQLGSTADTTVAGGILLGTDVQLHRAAANLLAVPDMISARTTAGTPYADLTSAASLVAVASNFALQLTDSARTANNKKAEMAWGGGNLDCRFTNDAYSAVANIFRATGGQATGVPLLSVPVAVSSVFGHTASVTVGNAGKLQVVGTTDATAQAQVSRHSADASGPIVALGKSRHATAGSNTIVQSGDALGSYDFWGANGSTYTLAGRIRGAVNGTPGAAADMPGRIEIQATPDGSGTPLEVARFESFASAVNGLQVINSVTTVGITLGAIGSDTDIDIKLVPKGAGLVSFGTHSALGAETVTGFLTMKDSGGTTRKIAVVS
jgi:hypothetical protein